MKPTLILLVGLPLLGSCSLSQGPAPMQPFHQGMQRSSLGVNQYESSTVSAPNTPDVNTDSLQLNFSHGYFVTDDIEVGGKLGYSDTDNGTTSLNAWTIDAYGRWYLDNRSRLRTWTQVFAGIGTSERAGTLPDDDTTQLGIGIGVSDMISESTSFDLGLDYRMFSKDRVGGNIDTDSIFLTAAFSVFYGG
ncbi:MAG: outer membrane beta-barrel protein [Planctomycetota bacterium]